MADWTPQSRAEEILFDTINGEPYDGLPQSRMEELLLELKDVIESGGGGGGGTDNYNLLKNLPQINGQTVKGNMSGTTLGLVNMVMGKDLSTNDYTNADKAIVDGVTSALAGKADAASVPTKTSELTNDSGFINNSANDLTNYYTKSAVDASLSGKVDTSSIGSANGVAALDANGRVPSSQLPSYVDDVLEYADLAHFPATGETGKIYIAEDTNKQYRWSGSNYAEISESLALGETSSTAYAGNKGKANADAIAGIKNGTNINSFGAVETALQSYTKKTYVDSLVGDLSSATTTDKSSVVAMVNELVSAINELVSNKCNNLTTEWFTVAGQSIQPHITSDYDIDITKSGYTALSVAGFYVGAGGGSAVVSAYLRGGTSARVRILNTGTTAAAPNDINICILYSKN